MASAGKPQCFAHNTNFIRCTKQVDEAIGTVCLRQKKDPIRIKITGTVFIESLGRFACRAFISIDDRQTETFGQCRLVLFHSRHKHYSRAFHRPFTAHAYRLNMTPLSSMSTALRSDMLRRCNDAACQRMCDFFRTACQCFIVTCGWYSRA